ncbi:hypothetical protein F511_46405 [Dorcoceras hygrometricum]|uniref:Uncharacterized protein n=1 Tax=Dorcoceras hygrometricum TaxID=472368 RepID=A0A2Z6ZU40_9LAMI|nr:hypothetical protein F511_46405 [Dorcoceras hygrometricum]
MVAGHGQQPCALRCALAAPRGRCWAPLRTNRCAISRHDGRCTVACDVAQVVAHAGRPDAAPCTLLVDAWSHDGRTLEAAGRATCARLCVALGAASCAGAVSFSWWRSSGDVVTADFF